MSEDTAWVLPSPSDLINDRMDEPQDQNDCAENAKEYVHVSGIPLLAFHNESRSAPPPHKVKVGRRGP